MPSLPSNSFLADIHNVGTMDIEAEDETALVCHILTSLRPASLGRRHGGLLSTTVAEALGLRRYDARYPPQKVEPTC